MTEQTSPERFAKVLQDTLDRPIAFHRAFVGLTRSVTAALMLSQALYWSKRATSNDEGWFYKTGEQWEEETGLSRFEQEGARKILRKFNFWNEMLQGVPAKMHYRVDIAALSNELLQNAESNKSKDKPNKNARLLKTSKQACGKPASKFEEKQQTSPLKTSDHYKGVSETTAEIKTTTPLSAESETDASAHSGGGRDFVARLLVGTVLRGANPGRIATAAKKYERKVDEIEKAIDVLDQQYRQSARKIDDPTALIVSALKEGIDPPEGYVPRAQRESEAEQRREAAKQKGDEDRKAKEAENEAYRAAEKELSGLPEEKREEIFEKAKTKLKAFMRNSQMAVKAEAIKMMIEKRKTK